MADTHAMLVAAGLLRRGHRPDLVARHTGLTVEAVQAVVERQRRHDESKAG
jgi:hypothetical protein